MNNTGDPEYAGLFSQLQCTVQQLHFKTVWQY